MTRNVFIFRLQPKVHVKKISPRKNDNVYDASTDNEDPYDVSTDEEEVANRNEKDGKNIEYLGINPSILPYLLVLYLQNMVCPRCLIILSESSFYSTVISTDPFIGCLPVISSPVAGTILFVARYCSKYLR